MKISPMRVVGGVSGVLVLTCILACGAFSKVQQASQRAKRQNDFKQLGLAALNYNDTHRTFPPDKDAFLKFAQQMAPEAVPFIEQTGPGGQITFHYGPWKIPQDFEPNGLSGTVLAYDNALHSGNRIALYADGTVQVISDAQLQTAPKPKKKEK